MLSNQTPARPKRVLSQLPRHPPTQSASYHWGFAARLHFPSEQRWSPAATPAWRPLRILTTACRSVGGQQALRGATPSDPGCPGRLPAHTKKHFTQDSPRNCCSLCNQKSYKCSLHWQTKYTFGVPKMMGRRVWFINLTKWIEIHW